MLKQAIAIFNSFIYLGNVKKEELLISVSNRTPDPALMYWAQQSNLPFVNPKHIHAFSTCDSTNTFALELIKKNQFFNKTLVLTKHQSKGRGRQGRPWASPKDNLALSILLGPFESMGALARLSQIAAFALCHTLNNLGIPCNIKWPNDVVSETNLKIAGILTEATQNHHLLGVLGIGINLKRPPLDPQELPPHAGFLSDFGLSTSPEDMLTRLLQAFADCALDHQTTYDRLFDQILSKQCLIGQSIAWTIHNRQETGMALGLNQDGALLATDTGGHTHILYASEVHLLPTP